MLPTTSLVDESEVFGRGRQKLELKEKLLTVNALENRIPAVIAIVGIGGVGKTTLAQVLYNDLEVMNEFELRAWAYVSEEFDVFKATKGAFVLGENDFRKSFSPFSACLAVTEDDIFRKMTSG